MRSAHRRRRPATRRSSARRHRAARNSTISRADAAAAQARSGSAAQPGGSRAPAGPLAADRRAGGAGGRGAGRGRAGAMEARPEARARRPRRASSTTRCIATANGCRRAVPSFRCCRRRTSRCASSCRETVVGELALGRASTIHCDGCAADVAAKITYVSNQAEYTPPVIYSNESRAKLVFMIEAHPSVADAARSFIRASPSTVTLQ